MFQVITMIDKIFDGKYLPVFLLDNSPIHKARANDSLNPRGMNVSDGGAQPKMRDGWYRQGDNIIVQSMVHQVYPFTKWHEYQILYFKKEGPKSGLAKGLKTVIEERFGEGAAKGEQSFLRKVNKSKCKQRHW